MIINFVGLRVWYPRNSNKPHLEPSQPEKDLTYTCLKTGMIQMIDNFFDMVTGKRNAKNMSTVTQKHTRVHHA